MRYIIEIPENGQITLTIGDGEPINIKRMDLNVERPAVVNEKKTTEGAGFVHLDPGPVGTFKVDAVLDYGPMRQI